jgi:hypothetical protein
VFSKFELQKKVFQPRLQVVELDTTKIGEDLQWGHRTTLNIFVNPTKKQVHQINKIDTK